jgi:hypothetical protein
MAKKTIEETCRDIMRNVVMRNICATWADLTGSCLGCRSLALAALEEADWTELEFEALHESTHLVHGR